MQVGSANTNLVFQLSKALQSSTEQTARHLQNVQNELQVTKDKILQRAVEQTAASAEIKGRLIDVTV